jgi:multidrug transporter EmrE-like cation transporter
MRILIGIMWGVLAQITTFLQLQGQMRYEWLKNNIWFGALMGIPISLMFMTSVKNFVLAYDGQIWPSRLIGFGIGVIVFTAMSYFLFKEPLTTKTIVCLLLGLCIILVQVLWR